MFFHTVRLVFSLYDIYSCILQYLLCNANLILDWRPLFSSLSYKSHFFFPVKLAAGSDKTFLFKLATCPNSDAHFALSIKSLKSGFEGSKGSGWCK